MAMNPCLCTREPTKPGEELTIPSFMYQTANSAYGTAIPRSSPSSQITRSYDRLAVRFCTLNYLFDDAHFSITGKREQSPSRLARNGNCELF
jgi:hypothetical protein